MNVEMVLSFASGWYGNMVFSKMCELYDLGFEKIRESNASTIVEKTVVPLFVSVGIMIGWLAYSSVEQ